MADDAEVVHGGIAEEYRLVAGWYPGVYSALLIGGAVFGAYLLAIGNATIALFAVAMAGIGLLTTVGVIVSMDSFGPVTDNAQRIRGMSGDVEGEAAQALTTGSDLRRGWRRRLGGSSWQPRRPASWPVTFCTSIPCCCSACISHS